MVECEVGWDKTAEIDADLFIRHDCIAWIWEAYLTTLRDIPITRAVMHQKTGVPATTQRRYEHVLHIDVIANYVFTNLSPELLVGYRENCVSYAFKWTDPTTGKEFIAYRIGNTRRVREPGIRQPTRKSVQGRPKPCNRKSVAICGKPDTERARRIRRFHLTHRSLKSALRRISKLDVANAVYQRPDELFELICGTRLKGTRAWRVEVV